MNERLDDFIKTSEKAKEFIVQSVKSDVNMASIESKEAIRMIQNGILPPLEPIEGKRFGLQSMLP